MKSTTTMSKIHFAGNGSEDKGRSLWYDAYLRLRRDKIAVISFFVIVFYLMMTLLASLGIIFDNYGIVNNTEVYLHPSWTHWFGTDLFGRDVLARAVHGTQTSL